MKCSVILCVMVSWRFCSTKNIRYLMGWAVCMLVFWCTVLVWTGHFLEICDECIQIFRKIEHLQQLSKIVCHVNDYCQAAVSVNMWSVYSNTPNLWPQVLSLKDLDRIWAAQDGKHEIIVKNIHDMLVKLAWDFSAEQLDHLFGCFQVRGSEVDGPCLNAQSILPHAGNK